MGVNDICYNNVVKEGIKMNEQWNLDILYKSIDDKSFTSDFASIDKWISTINQFDETNYPNQKIALVTILKDIGEYVTLASRLNAYLSLRLSTNTQDHECNAYNGQLMDKMSNTSKAFSRIEKFIANIDSLEELIESDDYLREYRFYLMEIKKNAKYLLSDEVEEVLSKTNIYSGEAWSTLQSYLTSVVKVDYQGDEVTLSNIRNLAYHQDKEVRKSAYEAELKAYEKIEDAIAFSLNNIKKQVNTISSLRGFESPLHMTLLDSRMKKASLDALLASMEKYLPKFQAYLKHKAKLLGYQNGLPWYELFTSFDASHRNFTLEEARDYLLKHFKDFSSDLCDMVERAFIEEWIDFYPRSGKVGGAFCHNLGFVKQSRILTNFNGSLGDVITLAHELGHAYHGLNIENHLPLNQEYSMPVAETASTFNENIIMNAAIEEAQGNEKIALIESQLQDLTQIICDIYSRYLFEQAVFEKSKSEFLTASDLKELMLDAQRKAYGDGIDESTLHPYMWVCKSHYYSSDLSFYNFPYAFGGLFARGLIMKYQEEKEAFLPMYKELLKATTISSVEDVAKMVDVDITSQSFWDGAFETCTSRIDEFLNMNQ